MGRSQATCRCHEVLPWGKKNLTLEIVPWRAWSYLSPPNGSSTCDLVLIATHIDTPNKVNYSNSLTLMRKRSCIEFPNIANGVVHKTFV